MRIEQGGNPLAHDKGSSKQPVGAPVFVDTFDSLPLHSSRTAGTDSPPYRLSSLARGWVFCCLALLLRWKEMAKRRRFSRTVKQVQLFASPGPLNAFSWRTIRRISREQGKKLVDDGLAFEVREGNKLLGFQLREKEEAPRPPRESRPGKAGITPAEMDAAVGAHGSSRTAFLDEEDRVIRVDRGFGEMDFVEAAQAKIAVYQSVH